MIHTVEKFVLSLITYFTCFERFTQIFCVNLTQDEYVRREHKHVKINTKM